MPLSVPDIVELYRTAGAERYGMEAVSQEEHALQCAVLAERAGSPPALVAAALLQDLGHLVQAEAADGARGDDRHECVAIPLLRGTFGDAVIEPIRLHVDAKRYLCAVVPGYRETLSAASQRSLALQGGPFTADQARDFIALPHAAEAVALRRWDDSAKYPRAGYPSWSRFLQVLGRASLGRGRFSAAA